MLGLRRACLALWLGTSIAFQASAIRPSHVRIVSHTAGEAGTLNRNRPVLLSERGPQPGDDDFDPTVDIPTNATAADLRPGGIGGVLSGLPVWFPFAIGWFLAPQMGVEMPSMPSDIFAAPTAQQERQILREERSIVSDRVERELYGR